MQQRILIIRLSAIGDVVMSSGMIPALRKAYPEAYIAWLAEPGPAVLLRANPRLDEVIVWPRPRWRGLWRDKRLFTLVGEIYRFSTNLRRRGFTRVLDVHGLLKSGVWARVSGAPERLGLGSKEGSQYLMTRNVGRGGSNERIGSEYRNLISLLGCDPRDFRLDLTLDETAAAAAESRLGEHGLTGRYAVIAPFTTRAQKHWLEPRWAELARRIEECFNLPVVMLGGPGDKAAASRVLGAGGRIHDFTGTAPLSVSAAVIRGSSLVVGVDTGLTHMGTAFRVPTVALFGPTRPYLEPDAPATRIVYKAPPHASYRDKTSGGGATTGMGGIRVDDVLEAAAAALEQV